MQQQFTDIDLLGTSLSYNTVLLNVMLASLSVADEFVDTPGATLALQVPRVVAGMFFFAVAVFLVWQRYFSSRINVYYSLWVTLLLAILYIVSLGLLIRRLNVTYGRGNVAKLQTRYEKVQLVGRVLVVFFSFLQFVYRFYRFRTVNETSVIMYTPVLVLTSLYQIVDALLTVIIVRKNARAGAAQAGG